MIIWWDLNLRYTHKGFISMGLFIMVQYRFYTAGTISMNLLTRQIQFYCVWNREGKHEFWKQILFSLQAKLSYNSVRARDKLDQNMDHYNIIIVVHILVQFIMLYYEPCGWCLITAVCSGSEFRIPPSSAGREQITFESDNWSTKGVINYQESSNW